MSGTASEPTKGLLVRAHTILLGIGVLYGLIVVLLMVPLIQTHILYAHRIDFFGYSRFEQPEYYGLAPGKTVNLKLRSSDNTTLGAWFILADPYYHDLGFPPLAQHRLEHEIPRAISMHPTILLLHGNTGTRALPLRIAHYTGLTSRLGANVLALDYRGFGDSEGHPTVEGVGRDARAAWDYLAAQGATPQDVTIVGHSLGTAIAALLSAQLGQEGIRSRGVVLMAPFSSVRSLMDTYYLFGCLPLLKPLAMVPVAPRILTWSLIHRFDTLTLVPEIKAPVLIVHAENDWDIPHSHSSILFEAFLEPHLPKLPTLPQNPIALDASAWTEYTEKRATRFARRKHLVSHTNISGFGALETFTEEGKEGRMIALLKTHVGEHDIVRIEGVQDVMGRMFGFL